MNLTKKQIDAYSTFIGVIYAVIAFLQSVGYINDNASVAIRGVLTLLLSYLIGKPATDAFGKISTTPVSPPSTPLN